MTPLEFLLFGINMLFLVVYCLQADCAFDVYEHP